MSTRMFGPSKEDLVDGHEGAHPGYPRDGACGQQPQLLSRCPRVVRRRRRHSVVPGQDLDFTGRRRHCSEMNTLRVCGPASAQSRGRVAWGQTLSMCPLWVLCLVAADRASPGQHSTRSQTPCRGTRRIFPRRAGMRLPCAQRAPGTPTSESAESEITQTN
jgi:hypothetical protein